MQTPIVVLCCYILLVRSDHNYRDAEWFVQGCSQSEMKHCSFPSTNWIPSVQPKIFHALTGQKGTNKKMPLNTTLGPWQVASLYCTLRTTCLFRCGLYSFSQGIRQWMGHSLQRLGSPARLFIRAQGSWVWNDSTFVLIGTTLTPGTHFSLSWLPGGLNQDSDSFEFFTFSLSLLEEPLGHL